jgi:hypothetical protein
MGSAYHPQSDGHTKWVNQCMETFLRCFVSACPSKWRTWLALAEFWYNLSFHSAIGRSPFEALYGYPARHFGKSDSCSVARLEEWIHSRQEVTELIRLHLNRAKVRMKNQGD